ncbi:hypothetical protein GTW25_16175 [Aliihoeflea aestuarii]|jgi:hypothetical protein|uniref:hypothetical protein n=1 Tax=Aliihoeflea aestuarii TaxID=453840 RepID=UPI002095C8F4|nr:hypothetical protein [Aliihoeflea aestuarii]MCO6392563.1 hypothetical protein [Aliihoeflea aestuarii]
MMRLLSRMFAVGKAGTAFREPGPKPLELAPLADGGNPIHALLDEIGLPWREPRGIVEARFGVSSDPFYRWEVISFDTATPIVPGLLRPLSAQTFLNLAPHLPITTFGGEVWFEDDARVNLRRTARSLGERLGPAPIGRQYNTIRCEWKAGAASIGLITWPPRWQSPALLNEAHERDPRLKTACSISIRTAFRPPLSAREQAWLDDFEPVAALGVGPRVAIGSVKNTPANEVDLEYVREPPADVAPFFDKLGHSRDRRALIFCDYQLFVIPNEDIIAFEIERLQRAKGPGGSSLYVVCRTTCPKVSSQRVRIMAGSKPDALNDIGRTIATALDRPLVIGEYEDDV